MLFDPGNRKVKKHTSFKNSAGQDRQLSLNRFFYFAKAHLSLTEEKKSKQNQGWIDCKFIKKLAIARKTERISWNLVKDFLEWCHLAPSC